MSIFATWLLLADADKSDAPAPHIYQGSHINPADDDPRAGWVEVAAIPNHCHPDVRSKRPEDLGEKDAGATPVEFLRLSVGQAAGSGQGDVRGQATVILDRSQVEQLQATLSAWLDTSER